MLESKLATIIKDALRPRISDRDWDRLRGLVYNRPWAGLLAFAMGDDLSRVASLYGTDKYGHHYYTAIYERFLRPRRKSVRHFLEIGVGGGANVFRGGHSLRMWSKYLPNAQIYSFDLYDKSRLATRRVRIFQADQSNVGAQEAIRRQLPQLDVVIDDGSHVNDHVLKSFRVFFPHLKPGGYYFIEDTQTSYWPEYAGGFPPPAASAVGLAKQIIDEINFAEVRSGQLSPPDPEMRAFSVACFHNLIVIEKFDPATHDY